jgi:hypothetical protein
MMPEHTSQPIVPPSGVVCVTGACGQNFTLSYDLGTAGIDDILTIGIVTRSGVSSRYYVWLADSILTLATIGNATHLWRMVSAAGGACINNDSERFIDIPLNDAGDNSGLPRYIGVSVDNVGGAGFNGGLNCYRLNGPSIVAIDGLA